MVLPTWVGFPTSILEIRITPHRHAQRPFSQVILDTFKLTMNRIHHIYVGVGGVGVWGWGCGGGYWMGEYRMIAICFS